MKRFLKIMFLVMPVFIIIWIVLEVINYQEYLSVKRDYESYMPDNYGWEQYGPVYRPFIVHKLFPNLDYQIYDKPVIYLYPTREEKVKVRLEYDGDIIADYPPYDSLQKGWRVTAYPDGKIIGADGKEYSYLFWEGKPSNNVDYDLSTGFVVRGEDTKEFLQNTLSKIGLTPKEYNEFIVYWYPRMKDNKYNLVHFAGKEYTDTAKLTITPEPDSMLRVFMVFKPLNKLIDIKSQKIEPFTRLGFSVVEWGGTELGK